MSNPLSKFFNLSLFMNGSLHFLILFIILNLLFWVVITSVSKKAIYDEVTGNLKTPMKILIDKLSNDQKSILASLPYDNLKNIYKEKNTVVTVNNNNLLNLTIILIVLIFLFVFALAIIYSKKKNEDMPIFSHILTENMFVFLFVGLIEMIFFLTIAVNFVPSLPSHIITTSKDIVVDIIDEQIIKNKDNKSTIDPAELLKAKENINAILSNPIFLINNQKKIETLKNVIFNKKN